MKNMIKKTVRLALVALGIMAFAMDAQAGKLTWALSEVKKDGTPVTGVMYLVADCYRYNNKVWYGRLGRDQLEGLANQGPVAMKSALDAYSAFKWNVTNGSGTFISGTAGQPTSEQFLYYSHKKNIGNFKFYAVVFDTAEITNTSKYYLTALTECEYSATAEKSIFFGSQAAASSAAGAWKSVGNDPTFDETNRYASNAWGTKFNPFAEPTTLPHWISNLCWHDEWTNSFRQTKAYVGFSDFEAQILTTSDPCARRNFQDQANWFLGADTFYTTTNTVLSNGAWDPNCVTTVVREVWGKHSFVENTLLKQFIDKFGQDYATQKTQEMSDAKAKTLLSLAFCELMRPHEMGATKGKHTTSHGANFSNLVSTVTGRFGTDYTSSWQAGQRMDGGVFFVNPDQRYKFSAQKEPMSNYLALLDDGGTSVAGEEYYGYGQGLKKCLAYLDQFPSDWSGSYRLPAKDDAVAKAEKTEWPMFDEDVYIDRGDVLMMKFACHALNASVKFMRAYRLTGDGGYDSATKKFTDKTEQNQFYLVQTNMHAILSGYTSNTGWTSGAMTDEFNRLGMPELVGPSKMAVQSRVEYMIYAVFHEMPTMLSKIERPEQMDAARTALKEAIRCYLNADAFIFGRSSKTGDPIVGARKSDQLHLFELVEEEGTEWNAAGWRYLAEQIWESLNTEKAAEFDLAKLGQQMNITTGDQAIDFGGIGPKRDGKLAVNVDALMKGKVTQDLVKDKSAIDLVTHYDYPFVRYTAEYVSGKGYVWGDYQKGFITNKKLKLTLSEDTVDTTLGGIYPTGLIDDLATMTARYPADGSAQLSGFAERLKVITCTREVVDGTKTLEAGKVYTAAPTTSLGGAFMVNSGATLTGTDVTFKDNETERMGGAIASEGTVVLKNAVFMNNKTTGDSGGAIFNFSALSLDGVTFEGNKAAGFGGAIYNVYGTINFDGPVTLVTASDTIYNNYMLNWNLAGGKAGCLNGYENLFCDGTLVKQQLTVDEYTTLPTNIVIATGDFSNVKGKDTFTIQNATLGNSTTAKINGGFVGIPGSLLSYKLVTEEVGTTTNLVLQVIPPTTVVVTDVTGATVTEVSTNGVAITEEPPYEVQWNAEVKVVYTADETYVFPNGATTWTTNFTANAETVTVTIPASEKPVLAVAKIGTTKYATLADAAKAAKDGDTVTLLKDATADDITCSAKVTLDLGGKTLTVEEGFTSVANLTLKNSDTTQGGFVINGTVTVSGGKLDASGLAVDVGGVIPGKAGGIFVQKGATFVMMSAWASLSPNWLAANRPGFLTAAGGGKVQMGSTVYMYKDGVFGTENTVAKAVITTAGGAGQVTYTEAFDTLPAAIAAANAGTTVELLKSVELDGPISIAKAVKLEIGNYNVTPSASFAGGDGLFFVNYGGDFDVHGAAGTIDASSNENIYEAIKLTVAGETYDGTTRAKLTVDANIKGYYYGITGNGSRPGTDIIVNGGTITAVADKDNLAIFNPQCDSTVTINYATLTGYLSAIEMRGGTLTVNSGTLIATATEYAVEASGSGTTTKGAAVAIAQHTTKGDITVTIENATLTGVKSVSVANPQGNTTSNVEVTLADANYEGALAFSADGNATVINDEAEIDPPAGYVWKDGVLAKAEAKIGDVYYPTLNAAAAAAKDGDTVTLLKDITTTAYVVFDKNSNVTLDLNGKTISSATDECIVVGKQGDSPLGTGTLTITGEGKVVQTYAGSDADVVWARWGNIVIENGYFEVNGTYQCVYSTSGSKVTINGGTFKNLTGGDVLNVSNTGATTDIQCFGGSFSKDPELGDDAMGGSFVAEGYYSRENEDLWSVFALPLVTATKITEGVPEGVDAAYQFSTDETAEGSFFATWEANFDVSFSKDIAAGTVELAGQYGEYPWTAMPLTEDLAAGEKWTLLPAGTVNFTELCAMKDFFCAIKNLTQANLGAGITVELTLSNGTKTYVLKTVDETFVRDLSPKAKIEELAEKPANLDVAYNCLPTMAEDAFFNGWEANITVSFDKDIAAGSLVLSGQYNTYDWTPYPITEDLAANEEIKLLPAGLVHYQDLYKMLGGFNCGVKNLDGDNVGTKMTVKIVLTSGEETVVMGEQGYTLKFNLPEAEVTKITEGVPEGVDAAYKFSTTESGEGSFFAKWEANFNVSFSKAVKAGSVELAGQYGEYPWTPMALTKDLAAGEKWTLLPAGTVNYEELCAMKDFFCAVKNLANENIGTGITVELTLTDGEKTYVVTTVDETLYQLGSPTAAITEVTPAGKNLDAQFNCQTTSKQEARFDKWGANFTVTFDKPVKAGSVILSGQYNEYPWTPMVLDRDLEAGEAWTLLDEGLVAVEDLYKMVGGFNCGIKNVSTANVGTTVTVKIVVNNGEKTFESATKDYTLAFNPPTATVTKMAPVPETLDDAYTFAVAADEVGEGTKSPFQDWTADFTVSFSKPIAAGTVELAGSYAAWQQGAWVRYNLPALAADEEYAVLKGFGLDTKLTYRELCDIVKSFSCGVLNTLKANEGTVMTVKLMMAKGEETCEITSVTSKLLGRSEKIDLGGGVEAKVIDNGYVEISGEGELKDVSKLAGHPITNLVVGSGITKIAANTFKNNRDMRTVTIGENCVEIGESAFGKVRNISNVVVKGSTKVADYAFLRCNSLEKLTFEGEVTFGKTPFAIHSAIYMKDGMPEIYTIPEVVIAGYRQALMGTDELKGEETEWTEITDEAEKANYHFFKVELKPVED